MMSRSHTLEVATASAALIGGNGVCRPFVHPLLGRGGVIQYLPTVLYFYPRFTAHTPRQGNESTSEKDRRALFRSFGNERHDPYIDYFGTMDVMTNTHTDLHKQLSCFVSLGDDDELAQLILEELAMPRRSYAGVLASMAMSPSSQSDLALNSIEEEAQNSDE